MGKAFFFGDSWVKHELRWRQEENRYSEYEKLPQERRQAGGRSRMATQASVVGVDSTDVHYRGDRVVILKEEPVAGGDDVNVYFERYNDAGTPIGTYASTWRKTRDGQVVNTGKARRIFSF